MSGRTSSLRTSEVSRVTTCALLGRQRLDGAAVEHAPLDGAALEHASLGSVELVEPRGEQRLDRRRDDDVAAAATPARQRDHLLDEERIALGGLADALAEVVVEVGRGSRSAGRSRRASSGSSRTFVAFTFPPAQPARRSRSSGRAMQSRRIGASRERSATCSTRSRNVSSPQWTSSSTQTIGRLDGDRLEQLPERPGDLVARRCRSSARRRRACDRRRCGRLELDRPAAA